MLSEKEIECCSILEKHAPQINALSYAYQFEEILGELHEVTDDKQHLTTAKDVLFEISWDSLPTALRDKDCFMERLNRIEEGVVKTM